MWLVNLKMEMYSKYYIHTYLFTYYVYQQRKYDILW